MGKPNLGDVRVDKILSSFSQRYSNLEYIADQILPLVKVSEKTGKFAKYGKENLRIFSTGLLRAPGAEAVEVDYTASQGTYACFERSAAKGIAWEAYQNTDDPYDPKRDATKHTIDLIMQANEYGLATAMSNNSIMTQYVALSGTQKWDEATYASDPIADIFTACEAVRTSTGRWPNLMVMPHKVRTALKKHPLIIERIKYTPGKQTGGSLTNSELEQAIADIFGIKKVVVGSAVYNQANEGAADSLTDIWGKNLWVIYRVETPTILEASFGYTIQDLPRTVDGWSEIWKKRDVVRTSWSYDQNICDVNLGYLIQNCIT